MKALAEAAVREGTELKKGIAAMEQKRRKCEAEIEQTC